MNNKTVMNNCLKMVGIFLFYIDMTVPEWILCFPKNKQGIILLGFLVYYSLLFFEGYS